MATRPKQKPGDRAMAVGLRALNRFAGSELVDRVGLRKPAERFLQNSTRRGFRAAGAAARTFAAAQKLAGPKRLPSAGPRALFDITPDDEQTMLRDAFKDFAAQMLRPAAAEADAACAAPDELLAQANELGLTTLGVPEELGGVVSERSAVTAVLAAEALAHGDMGITLAAMAPAAVSTAIGLWGDADQQAKYLPEFTGENVPAAALAIQEPRALFDPLKLETVARAQGGAYVVSGAKALVPRAEVAELFVVAAALEGKPALFVVEAKADGVLTKAQPAMGLRAAATGHLLLEDAPATLLGSAETYSECIALARIGWSALAVGCAQAVLDYVIPYVNERQAFGEPVSNRQAVAFAVADIGIELEGMRLLTYRAAALADQGKPFAREAALARRLCADKGAWIGSTGVQLLGGHGYVKEHPVERWYRDLRGAGMLEGGVLV